VTSDIELLSRLREAGVTLIPENGQLRVLAPEGALTPALREELVRQKQSILQLLKSANACESTGLPPITRAKREGNPTASYAQERLWFLYQLEPSAAYNIPFGVRLRGELNVPVLERCLNEIIQRHEALRTRFEAVDWQPVQVIEPARPLKILLTDLSALPPSQRETEAMKLCREEARRLFDFEEGIMMRALSFRLEARENILLLNIHHIASDGWSMGVLFAELKALYGAFVEGKPSPLAELPVQYADFAVWQRQWLQGEVLEKQLGYWKKQLEGAPALLELPADRPRPAIQSYEGTLFRGTLPRSLTEALQELSRARGTTLFMTLLSAFQVLLHRYSGSEDILVGTPIAGRHHAEIEELIGFFVNTLVMRGDLSGDPSFRTLLDRTRDRALEAYAHQDLPFERLVEELHPQRDMAHAPVFQVLFALQNTPGKGLALQGLEVSPVEVDTGTSKFDLSLVVRERDDGLETIFEYSTDLFDAPTIERMLGHYQRLLEGIVANPDENISRLPLLSENERKQILVEWNDTTAAYPKDKCLHELFEAQVERTPEAVAVVFGENSLTYGELNKRANQLARHLKGLGVGANSLVGICVERSLEMVVGLLGILKAGGAYVPLDPEYPKERLAFMLEDSGLKVLLTQRHLAVPQGGARLVRLDADWTTIAEQNRSNVPNVAAPDNLAYVIYTSGSTGKPKGVTIEHRNAVNFVHWGLSAFTNEEMAGVLASTSICFDLSVFELFVTLSRGGKVILAKNVLQLPDLAAKNQVTLINTVPSAMTALLREAAMPPGVQVVNLAGEALATSLVNQLYALPIKKVYDLYGPTETTTYSTWTLRQSDQPAKIGRPVANTRIHILDKQLQPVPAGVPGELLIGGDGLARGYHNRPELTAEKFIADPFSADPNARLYRTGDLARYLPNGDIQYLGRLDHQIKIRGFRVELGEIEGVLNKHSGIKDSVVVAREDAPGDKRLVAYLVSRNGPISLSELRIYLRAKLPEYMVPAAFVPLKALPLTPNGKVNRKALPKPDFEPSIDKLVPPATPTEIVLARIWREVLEIKHASTSDNFFESGGHSLLAVQLIGKINKTFNVNLPIPVFFQNPTIKGLAIVLDREDHNRRESKLIQLQPGQSGGTLFLLDISIGLCRLAQYMEDTGPAIYGTVVPLSRETFEAAARNEMDKLLSLHDLAAMHTALIRNHQPAGPCYLAGHSFAGLLAFEVAHQLRQAGIKVEMVFLLDSWATSPSWWKKLKVMTWARAKETLTYRASRLWSKIRTKMSRIKKPPASTSEPDGGQVLGLDEINRPIGDAPWEVWQKIYANARKDYQFIPLDVRAILFRTQQSDMARFYPVHGDLGWGGLFSRGLRIIEAPGDHFTLLKDPQASILAARVEECLKELSASNGLSTTREKKTGKLIRG
jgi:amino acid adenylation domain-containing protein